MIVELLVLAAGLTVLYFGAEWLVTAASKLAFSLGVTPLIIGLTVVAYGTSAPELVVTFAASWRGAAGVSLGNIVGSNICNIALILGVAALIRPLHVDAGTMRRDYPLMLASSAGLWLMAWIGGTVGRIDGAILLGGVLIYTWYTIQAARRAMRAKREAADGDGGGDGWVMHAMMIVVGIAALVLGAELMVRSAISIARSLGVSEFVIAVSVVAFGTSVPELATSAVAAFKGESDISVGNVIGSNLCNVMWVIGLVGLVFEVPTDTRSLTFDFPIMVAYSVLLYPLVRTGFHIGRGKGALLLSGYVAYVAALFLWR